MISLSKVIKSHLKLQQKTWHILLSLFHHWGDNRHSEQVAYPEKPWETFDFYVLVTQQCFDLITDHFLKAVLH